MIKIEAEARCSNCRFMKIWQDDLKCMRFPPQIFVEPISTGTRVSHGWPVVDGESWCGEHSPIAGGDK